MAHHEISYLPHSEVKIAFEVSVDEARPYFDEAVREISTARPLQGFRPGKATYQDVKTVYGEMAIYEQALERIVRAHYVKTILAEKINTVGSPSINVDQLTPGQSIKFSVVAPIEPKVEKLADLKKCKVTKKDVKVGDKEVDSALEEMRKMRRQETKVERAATMDDLVMIDLEMKKENVVIEGGTGRGYRVYLGEDHYIPGFTKEVEGMKAGDERTFTLPFPEEHYQKHLAGQKIDFTAKATEVFELKMPELNDEFAKGVGLDSMQVLREKLQENLTREQEQKSGEAAEIELLEKLVDGSTFTDVPQVLLNDEVRRMTEELQNSVTAQGMKWEDYLSSIKKTEADMKIDFVPQALRRIQTAVLIKEIVKQQKIEVTEDELDKEIDRIMAQIPEQDQETRQRIISPEYREYVEIRLRNSKALDWLKKECIG